MTPRVSRAAWGACLAVVLIAALPAPALGRDAPPRIPARAWLLIDATDRVRLAGREPGRSLSMASTTKLMTAYLALHRLSPDRRLIAPPYHPLPAESLLGLQAGERISVRDLLYGLLLPSGNDAAVTLADGVAGSTADFVREMNGAARRLGLRDTSYANPIGLDDPANYSSPRDLAKLTLSLRREGLFRRIVDTRRKTLMTGAHPRTVVNHNDLVLDVPWINGVKTGYTLDAGYVLVASGTRKDATLVSVVMGAPSTSARDSDSLALLRYGFSLYRRETPIERGQRLARRSLVNADARLSLVAAASVAAVVRRGQRVDVSVRAPVRVEAPVRRGERIGSATVTVDGELAGRVAVLASRSVAAPAAESVVERVDDALPGNRRVAWALAAALAAAIVIGIAVVLARRRRG